MKGCYLIHLDRPLGKKRTDAEREAMGLGPRVNKYYSSTARHYFGCSDDIDAREKAHRNGTGAAFLRAANEAGINWSIVRVWEGADFAFENRIKKQKNSPRLCPICRAEREQKNVE